MIKKTTLLLILFFTLSLGGFAQVRTWTPLLDNNWNNPNNWSGSAIPTVSNDVIINSGVGPIITGSAAAKKITITSNSLSIATGTLTVTEGITMTGVSQLFIENAGEIIVNAEVTITGSLVTISPTGKLTVTTGVTTKDGSIFTNEGEIVVTGSYFGIDNATYEQNAGGSLVVEEVIGVNNNGIFNLKAGTVTVNTSKDFGSGNNIPFYVTNGATLNIDSGTEIICNTPAGTAFFGNASIINNNGKITLPNIDFYNMEFNTIKGVLNLNDGSSITTSNLKNFTGTTINFTDTNTVNGNVTIENGSTAKISPTSIINGIDVLSNYGDITLPDGATLSSNAIGCFPGSNFTNSGAITVYSLGVHGVFTQNATGTLTVENVVGINDGGILNLTGGSDIVINSFYDFGALGKSPFYNYGAGSKLNIGAGSEIICNVGTGDYLFVNQAKINNSGAITMPNVTFKNQEATTTVGLFDFIDGSSVSFKNVLNETGATINFAGINTITGNINALTGSSIATKLNSNITVNGNFDYKSDITFTCKGNLKVEGNLNNTGKITFDASTNDRSSLITNGTITNTGTIQVNKFALNSEYAGSTGWDLVSPPVAGVNSDVYNPVSMYSHNEIDRVNSSPYTLITSVIPLTEQGYALESNKTDSFINFIGTPGTGDKTYDIYNTEYTTGQHYGWNLIANPYPSAIDWDLVVTENSSISINGAYQILHDQQWLVYNDGLGHVDKNIPIGQGFFVQSNKIGDEATNNIQSFSLPNSARVHDNRTAGYGTFGKKSGKKSEAKSDKIDYFELVATTSNGSDKSFYRVKGIASDGFDSKYDALKTMAWSSDIPNIYFNRNNDKLAISQEPLSEDAPIGFNMGMNGQVTFSIENPDGFVRILLEDKKANTSTDLLEQSYTFDYDSDLDTEDRFVLHFERQALSDNEIDKKVASVYISNRVLYVKNLNREKHSLNIYNSSGALVFSKTINGENAYNESLSLKAGVYIVNIIGENNSINEKLIIR